VSGFESDQLTDQIADKNPTHPALGKPISKNTVFKKIPRAG
jgi:hypothetical protein